ncbi:MAG: ribosome biogenesis GTPase Der [Phycisphaerales bacterium]|nr:ribosome biogenesis GTPase Der [Phycisphaerales bacterium]
MATAQIAIVGRPNVGKSSLLNKLAGKRVSIVDAVPGVTRDRVSTMIELDAPQELKTREKRWAELSDTGGWGVYTTDDNRIDDAGCDLNALTDDIEGQIGAAMGNADLILFVVDAQSGLTPLDHVVTDLLRKRGLADRVRLIANKVDGPSWESHAMEAAGLGFGEPMCVSTTSGRNMRHLREMLWDAVGTTEETPSSEEMKIAIVGCRNAGKSTLINALAGEERCIVSEIAGTTRDAVDVHFTMKDRSFLAIDTAGLRKRKSFSGDVEYYAYHRMLQAIRRADVVLFLVDATRKVSQVDAKLSQELQRQFKPTVIVVNKWDEVDGKASPEQYAEYLTGELRGLDYAPIVLASALEGEGLEDIVTMAFNLHAQATHREGTGSLNSVIKDILKKRGPTSRLGTQAKLFYVSQVATQPPTIAMVVNNPKLFEGRYERYLMNRLREELPFSEVPIRLVFSKRSRRDLQALKEGRMD